MYVLYGGRFTRALLVEMVMAEGGLPYELREVDIVRHEHREPGYLAVNPAGWVPALVTPEGETLYETPAINLYLAERHGLTRLAPRVDEADRGLFLSGFFYVGGELEPAMKRHFYPHRYVFRQEDEARMKERALEDALARIGVMEQRARPRRALPSGNAFQSRGPQHELLGGAPRAAGGAPCLPGGTPMHAPRHGPAQAAARLRFPGRTARRLRAPAVAGRRGEVGYGEGAGGPRPRAPPARGPPRYAREPLRSPREQADERRSTTDRLRRRLRAPRAAGLLAAPPSLRRPPRLRRRAGPDRGAREPGGADAAAWRRHPRRRVRGADHPRAPHPGAGSRRPARPPDRLPRPQLPGGAGGHPRIAARRRQSEPFLPGRGRRSAHPRDRRLRHPRDPAPL